MTALARAQRLFAELVEISADTPGVTRASYGPVENAAHAMIRREAEALRLEHRTDAIGNLYVTLPGSDRNAPILMTGSHLDSVPNGGNFDGAAGVLAGLVMLEKLSAGPRPACDVTVIAIRAEEMIWFPEHYLGSRAAFGLLPCDTPDRVRRSDTGRTLADHMLEAGFDPQMIRDGVAPLDPAKIKAFVEVHIEQGPVLIETNLPIGVVTGIRGNIRYRHARIAGETTHAGGVPRRSRHDAVLAGVELVASLDGWWQTAEAAGEDMVLTIGEFSTDPQQHGITKVPGVVSFTLDVRSQDDALLNRFAEFLHKRALEISAQRRVEIDLGTSTQAAAAPMSLDIRQALMTACRDCDVKYMEIPSGGGHDCATFASLGVPSGMLFIRNQNGSHNPHESMELDDFARSADVLTQWVKMAIR